MASVPYSSTPFAPSPFFAGGVSSSLTVSRVDLAFPELFPLLRNGEL